LGNQVYGRPAGIYEHPVAFTGILLNEPDIFPRIGVRIAEGGNIEGYE
jgi:hypothetical protein